MPWLRDSQAVVGIQRGCVVCSLRHFLPHDLGNDQKTNTAGAENVSHSFPDDLLRCFPELFSGVHEPRACTNEISQASDSSEVSVSMAPHRVSSESSHRDAERCHHFTIRLSMVKLCCNSNEERRQPTVLRRLPKTKRVDSQRANTDADHRRYDSIRDDRQRHGLKLARPEKLVLVNSDRGT